jgi:transcriptional regulator with XRE-family HTH domain
MRNLGLNLANEVKRARKAHRLSYSQNELGSLLGLNGQVISNLERGKNSLNIKHVIKISKILEIPFERLKKAMVQDYEDAINREVWVKLDLISANHNAGVELRKSEERRGSRMQEPGVYAYPVSSGGRSSVSR